MYILGYLNQMFGSNEAQKNYIFSMRLSKIDKIIRKNKQMIKKKISIYLTVEE